jgi:hypothetical protein
MEIDKSVLLLAAVLAVVGISFTAVKYRNDSAIATDTRRIADSFEKMAAEGRIVYIRKAPVKR